MRNACSFATLLLLTALGCGDDEATGSGGSSSDTTSGTTSAGGADGSGGEASGGGGPGTCADGTAEPPEGCPAQLGAWSAGPSLIQARDHHVTFVATTPEGAWLYVGAGTNGFEAFDSIERSAIAADGSLGPFEAAGTLPLGAIGPGLAQADGGVVLAGGLALDGSAVASTAATAVGRIADDGTPTFTAGPDMVNDRYHVSLVADRGHIYALGGLAQTGSSQSFSDAVERASFDGETLGAFEELGALPIPLTHQSVVVREHALYVVGGLTTGGAASLAIHRAAVEENGDLGDWEDAGELPEARATSAAFVHQDQLYVVAGATSAQGDEVASVLRAPFEEDGSVGTFEELAALPKARAHCHQAPMFETTVYSAGGAIGNAFQADVFLAKLEAPAAD